MDHEREIINKVAASGIISIDLESWYPAGERVLFDLKDFLFEETILKEKDFREKLKALDWNQYRDQYVAVDCTVDAVIPTWAFMLVASSLANVAKKVIKGSLLQLEEAIFSEIIAAVDPAGYANQRVVIKGCSKLPVPLSAYLELTGKLHPVVKSIMYGEPCSTVPVYKKSG